MTYHNDYETVPIGGGNPYHKCKHCHGSVPYINGELKNHGENCRYRIMKERELAIAKVKGRKITRSDIKKIVNKIQFENFVGSENWLLDLEDLEKFVDIVLQHERNL